jgi:hypothetical protein
MRSKSAIAGRQDRIQFVLPDFGDGLVEGKVFGSGTHGPHHLSRVVVICSHRQRAQIFGVFEWLIRPDASRRPNSYIKKLEASRCQCALIKRPGSCAHLSRYIDRLDDKRKRRKAEYRVGSLERPRERITPINAAVLRCSQHFARAYLHFIVEAVHRRDGALRVRGQEFSKSCQPDARDITLGIFGGHLPPNLGDSRGRNHPPNQSNRACCYENPSVNYPCSMHIARYRKLHVSALYYH